MLRKNPASFYTSVSSQIFIFFCLCSTNVFLPAPHEKNSLIFHAKTCLEISIKYKKIVQEFICKWKLHFTCYIYLWAKKLFRFFCWSSHNFHLFLLALQFQNVFDPYAHGAFWGSRNIRNFWWLKFSIDFSRITLIFGELASEASRWADCEEETLVHTLRKFR